MRAHFDRRSLLRWFGAVAVVAFAPYTSLAQNRLPNSAEIDSYLTGVIRDTRIPGMVALVVDADRIVYTGAFGRQDVARGVPMANDSIFRIASMTKPVTSVAVMMLVQEGDIGLDDPVSNWFPALPGADQVTVRMLLQNTSGYTQFTDTSEFLDRLDDLLRTILPAYQAEGRSYLTVAIGCTGGRHRSVYLVERLADGFRGEWKVLVRHRGLARTGQE